jgi:hypothetical protein
MRGIRTGVSSVLASTITVGISAAEQWSHDIGSLGLDGSAKSSNRGGLEPAGPGPFVGCSAARASTFYWRQQVEGQVGLKRFCYEMFYYISQEDRARWYQGAVLRTKDFPIAPKANGCDFASGTTAKSRDGSSAVSDAFEGCDFA